ncbi:hypothetical protein [Bacillus sp. Bva_UNVM-123]
MNRWNNSSLSNESSGKIKRKQTRKNVRVLSSGGCMCGKLRKK